LTPHVAARRAILAAAIFTFPLVASCDGDPEATPSTSVTSTTPTPSPASSSPADPKQVASDGAIAGYKHWVAEVYRMQASGGRDVSMLPAVSAGTQLNLDRSQARQLAREGVRAQSPAKILWARAAKTEAGPSGSITVVSITACEDVSVARWVDAKGHSAVVKGRPPRLIDTARMSLIGTVWKAALVTNKQATSC